MHATKRDKMLKKSFTGGKAGEKGNLKERKSVTPKKKFTFCCMTMSRTQRTIPQALSMLNRKENGKTNEVRKINSNSQGCGSRSGSALILERKSGSA
jgi:hypothetical protein